jgi:hypothetical protein
MSAVVTLQNAALEVDPGSSRDAIVRVRNTGQIVDRFSIEILGRASAWAAVSPSAVSLFPGAEESVRVAFSPPRGSIPRAGRIVFGVRVRSIGNPVDSVVEEGAVTVLPAVATTAAIVPQTSRGRRGGRHDVKVTNGGNVPIEAAIQPADPDRLLSFDVQPPRIALEPGATGSVRLGVHPNETFYLGAPQSKPFGVTVVSSGQAPLEVRATMLQRALLPSWLPKVVAGVLVLGLAGGVMAATVLRQTPTPSPTPASSAVAQVFSPSPTASLVVESSQPSVLATEVPSDPAGPSATPVPSFALEPITTDVVSTNFALVCVEATCQADVINGMRFLAANLQETYFGGGLSGTTNFEPDQIPVVLKADVPFPWRQGETIGTTDRFVVDLAPAIFGIGPAYAVLVDDSALLHRNYLPNDFALQLFDRLYDSKAMPVPTYTPIDWGIVGDQVRLPIDRIFVALPTPTP